MESQILGISIPKILALLFPLTNPVLLGPDSYPVLLRILHPPQQVAQMGELVLSAMIVKQHCVAD